MRKKIIVIGPALSQTGYGEQCRFALRALLSRDDLFDVYLKPLPWGKSSWLSPNDEDRVWIDHLIKKTMFHVQNKGNFDVTFQVTIPNEWEKIAPINIGYTAGIETTKVSPKWIEKAELMDKIITISNHSKNTYQETVYDAEVEGTGEQIKFRCETPIEVVHYPVRNYKPIHSNLELEYDFNYLIVAQWGPRKNIENTIKWWMSEFKDEEVGLVIKTNLVKTSVIDRVHTEDRLRQLLSEYKDRKCKVYLLHGNMSPEEMTGLYQNDKIKCLVSLTHGEGFGLPLFEAAYNGLPVVAPDWSGHKDFLYAKKKVRRKNKRVTKEVAHFAKVDYELKPISKDAVWDGVLQKDSHWCYAKKDSYKSKIRDVFENYKKYDKLAVELKSRVIKNFNEQDKYNDMVEAVKSVCNFTTEQEIDSMFETLLKAK